MSNKKPPGIEKLEKSQEPVVQFNKTALGLVRDEKTGQFTLVEIPYDSVTGQTGSIVMRPVDGGRYEAYDQFKVRVVELGIME